MSPPPGTEAVTARQEIRLQDRLQHQRQRRLGHPVGDGRDPQAALLAARLGDHPLPHWDRAEAAVLQTRPQPVEELLHPNHGLHVVGTMAIHASRFSASVMPHPIPGHKQKGRVGDKVEHIIKPAMRIIPGPTVQLRLDLQYPAARHIRGGLQLTGVHQRLPAFQHLGCGLAGPLRHVPRLSRARTTTRPPPHPAAHSRQRACPPPDRLPGGQGDRGWFPRSPDHRSARPALSYTPAARHTYAADLQRGLPTVCCTRLRS
jgi:hypothetical protein